MPVDLSLIIPTLNEQGNIQPLFERLSAVLKDRSWEIIFVDDDSQDGTIATIKQLAETNPEVRYIHRLGRKGLSSAVIEGMVLSDAKFYGVMDADLQHDENILPQMMDLFQSGDIDVVVGSRYVKGGESGSGFNWFRLLGSQVTTWLGQRVSRTQVLDPLSGFFIIRAEVFEAVQNKIFGRGFKILLDILSSSSRPLNCREVPFTFRQRHSGESKLDWKVVIGYFGMLIRNFIRR